jgi:hypothetical protein
MDAPLQRRQVRLPSDCDGSSPISLFSQFFTEAIYRQLAANTNENIQDHGDSPDGPKEVPKLVSVMEIKIMIALKLLMSIYRLPNLEFYWDRGFKVPKTGSFRDKMSYRRFRDIWSYFKVSNRRDEQRALDRQGVGPKVS